MDSRSPLNGDPDESWSSWPAINALFTDSEQLSPVALFNSLSNNEHYPVASGQQYISGRGLPSPVMRTIAPQGCFVRHLFTKLIDLGHTDMRFRMLQVSQAYLTIPPMGPAQTSSIMVPFKG